MHFSALLSVLLLPIGSALALNYTVLVGENGGKTFNPTSVSNATVGDTIIFQFVSGNHTATQSTFAAPCAQMTTPKTGIDSDYQFVEAGSKSNKAWSFTMDEAAAAAPLWFFCKQATHCSTGGMVFSVNPPQSGDKTFAAFQAAATAATTTGTTSASSIESASTPKPTNGARSASVSSLLLGGLLLLGMLI